MITARTVQVSLPRRAIGRWLGPREYLGWRARFAWLAVSAVCAAVLTIAAMISPDPRGHGTHEALGLPPCSFVLTSGLPCPTCGMTTAFAHVMHGQPWRAVLAQPAGAVICAMTIILMIASFRAAVSGYMVAPNWDRVGPVRFMLGFGFLLLAGWGFKVAHGLATGILPYR